MRIAIASIAELPPEFRDDQRLALALERRGVGVETHAWDDEAVDWPAYDLVVIRSTWDYTSRRDEFVAWSATVGERLENAPEVIRWNSDKGYLADLEATGLPVVETRYLGPGDPLPAIEAEIVIKPTVSGGARDTGRFGPDSAPTAIELVDRIHAAGRTAMVQPFLDSVDSSGETALVMIAGEASHALRKRAVLRADEIAPTRSDGVGAAEAMYDPDLVVVGGATRAELELADQVLAEVGRRFGSAPLYARVDMLAGPDRSPVLLELEAVEPHLYLDQVRGAADRFAGAIIARAA